MLRVSPGWRRKLHKKIIKADLAVVGGGLSGLCCAITAARCGISVVLVQDRPVLGGNASSEVRLWVLGATSHMGNNNRWAREGGVIDEILVENLWRNPEGNPVIFDSILLEFAKGEQNLELLLNTAIDSVETDSRGNITVAQGFCSQTQTLYELHAPLYCDASGDGILGFLAGAPFRVGAEGKEEFREGLAPTSPSLELLGHSLYFYARDTGRPVSFVAPKFALKDIRQIPRFRELNVQEDGCRLWWLEYGGTRDTVHDSEEIKWELWRVAYGVWDYLKNSGLFPEAETLTLEWMGTIPGKRESRRFEGDYILTQHDIIDQRKHEDAVSFGGWAIDLHPAEGVYSAQPGCTQWHSKGIYTIPYRTMYSRSVPNLFLTGRLLSASHIAFGSTRVMATAAHNGQAVGAAAAICTQKQLLPSDLSSPNEIKHLQQKLLRLGQWVPGLMDEDSSNLLKAAAISASTERLFDSVKGNGRFIPLSAPIALLLPLLPGPVPTFRFNIKATRQVEVTAELWGSSREGNTTPDVLLISKTIRVLPDDHSLCIDFDFLIDKQAHYFVAINGPEIVQLEVSTELLPGVLLLTQKMNKSVAKSTLQEPPSEVGVDSFAFWLPDRRPAPQMLAVEVTPPPALFAANNVANGIARPWCGSNAWVPASIDLEPRLRFDWPSPVTIRSVEIMFDTDFDHPMESVLMGHPERVMPACVRAFDLSTTDGTLVARVHDNHQTCYRLELTTPIETSDLCLTLREWGPVPPVVFAVRCY